MSDWILRRLALYDYQTGRPEATFLSTSHFQIISMKNYQTLKFLFFLFLIGSGVPLAVSGQGSQCRQGTNSAYYYGPIGTHTALMWGSNNVNGSRCIEWQGDIDTFSYEWNLSSGGSIGRVARDANSPGFNPQRVDDCGPLNVQRTTTLTHNGQGDYNNMIYGWLGPNPNDFAPASIEWYVIDDYNNKWGENAEEYLGQVTTNGSVYDCYRGPHLGHIQYLAFRLDKRSSGTVSVKAIMDFWRSKGMPNDYVVEIGVGEENFNAGGGTWEGTDIVIPACDEPGTTSPEEPEPQPENPGETTSISPSNSNLQYTGRIDASDPNAPKLYYAGSSITTKFEGTSLQARFSEDNWGGSQHVGFIIDGGEMIIREVANGANDVTVEVASGLENTTHDLIVVKRESPGDDNLIFLGLTLDEGAGLSAPDPGPTRRIELYGNSVTQGVNADNTVDAEGGDEVHNGWGSYGMILARQLNAECHNQALSGLAVQDGTGFWNGSAGGIGLVSTYDQINANDGRQTAWDFSGYTPHLVVMAMGINDNGFIDEGEKESWKDSYKSVINDLRNNQYPNADFVLTVPPLGTEYTRIEGYVEEIVNELNDPDVHYFDLTVAVPAAHPNAAVHTAMADQLEAFVNTLDIDWGDDSTPQPEPEPPVAGEETITIRAQGDCGSEAMELRVDGTPVATWEGIATSPTDYTYEKFSGEGQISVHFTNNNDVEAGCEDRNLLVDYLEVCGTTYQTEAVAAKTSTCCPESLDKLFTNGNFNYGTLTCDAGPTGPTNPGASGQVVIRAKGTSGGERMRLRVDDEVVDTWTVTTTATDYTYDGYRGGELEVVFDNDASNLDLQIDYLEVCGVRQQAESVGVRSQNCGETVDGFVWLWCNSSLSFGDVGCASSAVAGVRSSSRIGSGLSEVHVYPNPTAQRIVIDGPEHYQTTLYDLQGKVVRQRTRQSGQSSLNVASLRPGTYLLQWRDTDTHQTYQERIIIK